MKKVLQKTVLLTSCLCLSLFLGGCHGSRETKQFEVPEEFDTSKQYEITFWAKNDTNKAQSDIYKQAIADFQEIYPNITVNLKPYTDYVKLKNDVITNIGTGTTPNVCITYPDHVATYMSGENIMAPLDDLFTDEKYGFGGSEIRFDGVKQGEMVDKFLEECHLSGHYYAVPYMRSTEACYINKNLVEKLGYEIPDVLTWDFIWEVSEKAMAKDENDNFVINGQKVMIPFIYKSTDNMMIQYLNQKQADYSSAGGDILIFNDDTKEFLYEISEHVKTRAFSTFQISSYPGNFLNAGQCIFAVDSTAGSTWMGSKAPLSDIDASKIVDFETVVRMIPQVNPESPSMISQGPSLCIFNKEDPQEVLAAWIFTQYMLSDAVQIPYSETEGYVPVTKKAQNNPEYLVYLSHTGEESKEYYDVKLQAVHLFLENIENTFTTPVFNGSADLREAAGYMIEETAKSTRRKKDVNEAFMAKLYEDTNALYRLDQINRASGKQKLGALPAGSIALLVILAITWVGIGLYYGKEMLKNRKKK